MQWEGREESSNVEDRRSLAPAGLAVGGGGILLVIVALLLGVDPRKLLGPGGVGQIAQQQEQGPPSPEEEKMAHFSKIIFKDTEIVWEEQFRKMGKRYQLPTLVLYRGVVESACGQAESAVGPFYCPGDSKVYIDLSF